MCQNSYKGFNQNQGKAGGIIHCCASVQTIALILAIFFVWYQHWCHWYMNYDVNRLLNVWLLKTEKLANFRNYMTCDQGIASNQMLGGERGKKSLIYLEVKSMTPHWETLFSAVPPSNSLFSILDPWRAFWADMASFKDPQLALCVSSGATVIQVYIQLCSTWQEDPRHCKEQLTQTLLCVCRKRTCFRCSDCSKARNAWI